MSALRHESFADVLRANDQSLVPPATLAEARQRRDALAGLLGREREAAADFLLALADFDRRRGWERLGHASLFAFLTRELGLSKGAAYLRFTAARLLPRHPAVERALRQGQLCLSAVGELSRVLSPENEAEVLPRFLGRSAREAKEVVAELSPCPEPPSRAVVTLVPAPSSPAASPPSALALPASSAPCGVSMAPAAALAGQADPVRTSEPDRAPPPRPPGSAVEPLTGDLRRLHVTVSRRFLEKVAKARDGLSHSLPGATTEQVLEAALDLLLERQAKALVKRPRKERSPSPTPTATPTSPPTPTPTPTSTSTPTPTPTSTSTSTPTPTPTSPPTSTPTAPAPAPGSPHVPAHVEREVRLRDGDRCQFPLDAGGVCGSTWQVQLDHLVPRALGGPTTAANLRCACSFHNRYAAELELGASAAGVRRRE